MQQLQIKIKGVFIDASTLSGIVALLQTGGARSG
jgi:hypothetical protein